MTKEFKNDGMTEIQREAFAKVSKLKRKYDEVEFKTVVSYDMVTIAKIALVLNDNNPIMAAVNTGNKLIGITRYIDTYVKKYGQPSFTNEELAEVDEMLITTLDRIYNEDGRVAKRKEKEKVSAK